MSQPILTFVTLLASFQTAFSSPAFYRFFLLSVGWILTPGRHAVTAALVALGISGTHHHAGFHSFFADMAWSADTLGKKLFQTLIALLPEGAMLTLVIDDTLTHHRGAHVFGKGVHIDAVRSSQKWKVLAFGHCWVVLSVVVQLPGLPRAYALPVLFRLYRNRKDFKNSKDFKTKLQLARELLDLILEWAGDRRIHLGIDGAYCNGPMLIGLPETVVVFGRLRIDADLRGPASERVYKGRGRRPKYGEKCPRPKDLAADPSAVWETGRTTLYGQEREVRFLERVCCWPKVLGERLLKVVVVPPDRPGRRTEAFFCTQADMVPLMLLAVYSLRWPTEVTFRDLKQFLGFGEIGSWTEWAVKRTAPWVGLLYSLVVIWYSQVQAQGVTAPLPLRPWYRQRRGPSFEDMLRCLQNTLRDPAFLQVLANPVDLKNLLAEVEPQRPHQRRAA